MDTIELPETPFETAEAMARFWKGKAKELDQLWVEACAKKDALQAKLEKLENFRVRLCLSLAGNFMLAIFAIFLIVMDPNMETSTKISWSLIVGGVFGVLPLWLLIRTFKHAFKR